MRNCQERMPKTSFPLRNPTTTACRVFSGRAAPTRSCGSHFIGSSRDSCLPRSYSWLTLALKDGWQLVGHIHRVIKAYALVGPTERGKKSRRRRGRRKGEYWSLLKATCRTNLYLRLWKFMMRLRHLSVIQCLAVNATV